VLSENDGRWDELTPADRERVAVVARTIVRRLLHEPTRRLRADGETGAADIALELFGLAPTPSEQPAVAVAELGQRS
jgi:glutamyl-tRNA reductase